jgi:hypothetical protein
MKKMILAVIALTVLTAGLVLAIDREEKRELMQELGDELRTYAEENIHPQMMNWKEQIDNEVSTSELEKLNQLRAEASKFMDEMKSQRPNMRGMNKGRINKGENKGQRNRDMQMNRNAREGKQKFADELDEIIENHPDFFTGLFEEVETKQTVWKNDMKEIKDNWLEENKTELDDMPNKSKMKGMFRAHNIENRFRNPEHILLWNGVPPRKPKMNNNFGSTKIESYNSPNPFSESTSIHYSIEDAGNYTIEVINSAGNKIETLHSGNLNEGEHTFSFAAKNLEPGVYFYKISGEGLEQTEKMIISK